MVRLALKMSEPDSPHFDPNQFDTLDRLLREAQETGKLVAQKGREVTKSGQFVQDMASATRDALRIYKPPQNLVFLNDSWRIVNQEAEALLSGIGQVRLGSFLNSGSTVAYGTSDAFPTDEIIPQLPPQDQAAALVTLSHLHEVTGRLADKHEVARIMTNLGLDKPVPGKKSPLELFITAHDAFEDPVCDSNPISTSLIPIREAAQLSVQELLHRRPRQEKTSAQWEKIVSIGGQLKKDSVPDALVQTWAYQWKTLLRKYLHPSKQQELSRADWQTRLQQSTLFLRGFLGGLDPSKFR